MNMLSRRKFLATLIYGTGSVVLSAGCAGTLSGCLGEGLKGHFNHGVASGDPLHDRVILWTRATPVDLTAPALHVQWEVATDPALKNVIRSGSALAYAENDYTLKVDVINLAPNKNYYYRFSTSSDQSRIGKTKTLPKGDVSQVKLLVMSCATYPAGYFHVYAEAAKQPDINAAVHLGDYIYEHERGGYASEDAEALGRLVHPEHELITLDDYRTRYGQYRKDKDLQDFHASIPLIAVWDDHEIANNVWREGAQNHSDDTEGLFMDRLVAALKAYSEWMPIRPKVDEDIGSLYRGFQFGNLVNLLMLDSRIVGRDLSLEVTNYVRPDGSFDEEQYSLEVNDPNRRMLGANQLDWLDDQFDSVCKWSVLGQQTLMGEMKLPGAIATRQLSVSQFAALAAAAQIAATSPDQLTEEQQLLLNEKRHLLTLPSLPYNLGAWDGYPAERQNILGMAASHNAKLVVLAGDTHNAWANNLKLDSSVVGIEFATASVTSPGIEAAFGLETPDQIAATEAGVRQLIKNVKYTNLADRGFLTVTFTPDAVSADWTFVTSIKERTYQVNDNRGNKITVSIEKVELA